MVYRKTEKVQSRLLATRKLIIACSIDIIAAEGIEGLTTRALAERAEIAHGRIYLHFADTRELVNAIAVELRDRDLEAIREIAAKAALPLPSLIAGIRTLIRRVTSKYQLMSAMACLPGYRDSIQAELGRLIKATEPDGRPAILAAVVFGAIFQTARMGPRAEQTLLYALLRALGVPARQIETAVF